MSCWYIDNVHGHKQFVSLLDPLLRRFFLIHRVCSLLSLCRWKLSVLCAEQLVFGLSLGPWYTGLRLPLHCRLRNSLPPWAVFVQWQLSLHCLPDWLFFLTIITHLLHKLFSKLLNSVIWLQFVCNVCRQMCSRVLLLHWVRPLFALCDRVLPKQRTPDCLCFMPCLSFDCWHWVEFICKLSWFAHELCHLTKPEVCPVGTNSSTGLQPCSLCPMDSYAAATGLSVCTSCAAGTATVLLGSNSSNACIGDTFIPNFQILTLKVCATRGHFLPPGLCRVQLAPSAPSPNVLSRLFVVLVHLALPRRLLVPTAALFVPIAALLVKHHRLELNPVQLAPLASSRIRLPRRAASRVHQALQQFPLVPHRL